MGLTWASPEIREYSKCYQEWYYGAGKKFLLLLLNQKHCRVLGCSR